MAEALGLFMIAAGGALGLMIIAFIVGDDDDRG